MAQRRESAGKKRQPQGQIIEGGPALRLKGAGPPQGVAVGAGPGIATTSAAEAAKRSMLSFAVMSVASGGNARADSDSFSIRARAAGLLVPTASESTINVSARPSKSRAPNSFSSGSASNPARKVRRLAARFPLSTDDTYMGSRGLQRLRVIPVVKVAPVPLQACHRAQGFVRALDELPDGNVAEVAGRQIREQGKPHVGRRRPVRNRRNRLFLVIVGWQPMVIGTDESLEEGPGSCGKASLRK